MSNKSSDNKAEAEPAPAPAGSEHDLGRRLAALRRLRRLSLRALAERAGLSPAFLSQLERGTANPSVSTLRRLAHGLSVDVTDLFDTEGHPATRVLRRADRPRIRFGESSQKFLVSPRLSQNLETYFAELAPGDQTAEEPYAHGDSEELFLVVSGEVQVHIDAEIYTLGPGDSVCYQSSLPHLVSNISQEAASFIWIISPPSSAWGESR